MMYWQENPSEQSFRVPDDVVDVLFAVECRSLPVDHAYALSAALREALPWIGDEREGVGVHTIHVAGSQNGWERPAHGSDQDLVLSRRTKLSIRLPRARADEALATLPGQSFDISGRRLVVREGKVRSLSKETTLFARYVVVPGTDDEDAFLAWAVDELRAMGVQVRKALCGKETVLDTPDGPIRTRSLMLADLSPEASVRLQQEGLGPRRGMGCGIFIPHKGIEPVKGGG